MQPQKQYVHKRIWHKGSQSNWTGSHTETRVVIGPGTFTLTHIGGQDTLQVGPEVYRRHQGTQAGKTRNQRSLTFKYSLATLGGFQKNSC